MTREELLQTLNNWLAPEKFMDAAHNGLQVEGCSEINRVVCGVSANRALIEQAVLKKAQAIFVHHGLFWEPGLKKLDGFMKERLALLLKHDINLFAYHLPLDAHETLGNNAQLFCALGLNDGSRQGFGEYKKQTIGVMGELPAPLTSGELEKLVEITIGPINFSLGARRANISRIAICSGAAPELIHQAIDAKAHAFICGEATEWVTSIAEESDILFLAAGHHRTETFGPKAISAALNQLEGLESEFIDIQNQV